MQSAVEEFKLQVSSRCMCLHLLATNCEFARNSNLSLPGCRPEQHCHKPVRRQTKHVSLHPVVNLTDTLLFACSVLSR